LASTRGYRMAIGRRDPFEQEQTLRLFVTQRFRTGRCHFCRCHFLTLS